MPHRAHLFSLRIAHALRESCLDQPYGRQRLLQDVMAGMTVGVIAIPLAMALAIASGVAPQYGLYTAIIGGFLIPLTGGSRYSVSGPTAAFVVILYPVAQAHGLAGLLLASLMAGAILVLMALFRLGRFIEYIPEPVTLGFTAGIAVVIATLQFKDFLGLQVEQMPTHYLEKLLVLIHAMPTVDLASLGVGVLTLAVMLVWPRLGTPVPPHLPAVLLASLAAYLLAGTGVQIETIATRFQYLLPDGSIGQGIPPFLPEFEWPWRQAGPDGRSLQFSWALVQELLGAAFAIAMLGAIESLLCAVVVDGMTGQRHSANSELLGQGLGNLVVPFFGGITATAAIARSAANVRAGAQSPVAAMVHALVVLLALVMLAQALALLPMPALAALLFVVAWNMSEARKALHLVRTAPRGDVMVFVTCFSLTVLLDMVIAVTAGILLAALLFMKEIAEMTKLSEVTGQRRIVPEPVAEGWQVFKISGPLFFAAADRVFGELSLHCPASKGIVLYLDGVPILDAGGLAALNKLMEHCSRRGTVLYLADLQFQPLRTLARARVRPVPGRLQFFPTLAEALQHVPRLESEDNQRLQSSGSRTKELN